MKKRIFYGSIKHESWINTIIFVFIDSFIGIKIDGSWGIRIDMFVDRMFKLKLNYSINE